MSCWRNEQFWFKEQQNVLRVFLSCCFVLLKIVKKSLPLPFPFPSLCGGGGRMSVLRCWSFVIYALFIAYKLCVTSLSRVSQVCERIKWDCTLVQQQRNYQIIPVLAVSKNITNVSPFVGALKVPNENVRGFVLCCCFVTNCSALNTVQLAEAVSASTKTTTTATATATMMNPNGKST